MQNNNSHPRYYPYKHTERASVLFSGLSLLQEVCILFRLVSFLVSTFLRGFVALTADEERTYCRAIKIADLPKPTVPA